MAGEVAGGRRRPRRAAGRRRALTMAGRQRHPRGGRALARAERKDVQIGEAAHSSTSASVASNIASSSVGETGDEVGAEGDVRAQAAGLGAEGDGVGAGVAALHALEDHVVARLERQMQMRHQPRLFGDEPQQRWIGLDRIERGDPQALPVPAPACRIFAARSPELRRPRQVGAVGGDVDAGQDDLGSAALDQAADLPTTSPIGTLRELPRP